MDRRLDSTWRFPPACRMFLSRDGGIEAATFPKTRKANAVGAWSKRKSGAAHLIRARGNTLAHVEIVFVCSAESHADASRANGKHRGRSNKRLGSPTSAARTRANVTTRGL